jgi:hypothetical protein
MSDEEIAALRKRIEELEGKVDPPKSTFVTMTDEEWRDQMHQLSEKRMSMATPPSVVRDWAVIPEDIVKGIREDRHAPTSATGMIPSTQQRVPVREVAGDGSGWQANSVGATSRRRSGRPADGRTRSSRQDRTCSSDRSARGSNASSEREGMSRARMGFACTRCLFRHDGERGCLETK